MVDEAARPLRKNYQAFGRGSLEFLYPDNHKVLVFTRRFQDEIILVVANLSRFVNYVELDLAAYKGTVPVELFGHTRFPAIGELPYFLTLGPMPSIGSSWSKRASLRPALPRKDSSRRAWKSPTPGKIFCTAGPAPAWSESSRPISSPAAGSAAKRSRFVP